MAFALSFWRKTEKVAVETAAQDVVDVANELVEARMGVLRASLVARAAQHRAQAKITNDRTLQIELIARAAEDDFISGQAQG